LSGWVLAETAGGEESVSTRKREVYIHIDVCVQQKE
jgi:hypothetical protein